MYCVGMPGAMVPCHTVHMSLYLYTNNKSAPCHSVSLMNVKLAVPDLFNLTGEKTLMINNINLYIYVASYNGQCFTKTGKSIHVKRIV